MAVDAGSANPASTGGVTWLQWALLWLMSSWGGVASYIEKARAKGRLVDHFAFVELLAEVAVSGLSGMVCGLLAMELGWDIRAVLAVSAIGGHMGTRSAFRFLRRMVAKSEGESD